MKPTQRLHRIGQRIWLDSISRALLNTGTLRYYLDELCVTGLTSNPTSFTNAISKSDDYDADIRLKRSEGLTNEELFFDLALDDISAAAELFRPANLATNGVEGWVSLEVSPELAYDAAGTLAAAEELYARAGRRNVFIKIPGTTPGLLAVEEAIYAGISVNVTLLFSREQYLAAAHAFLRGLERRLEAGLSLAVYSVASVFVSRWDSAVAGHVPHELHNRLGIAVATQTYQAYRELIDSPRYGRLTNAGARPQRLVWASTGVKDPDAPDLLYANALQAPFTINSMPEDTLLDFADHGEVNELLPANGGAVEATLRSFAHAGVDVDTLAGQLQQEGTDEFVKSWDGLMTSIAAKSDQLAGVH